MRHQANLGTGCFIKGNNIKLITNCPIVGIGNFLYALKNTKAKCISIIQNIER